jgi:predicted RNase H-like nuclease (RuvC/YqgF family)
MNEEIGSELAALRDIVTAGFTRVDRYFELQQAQHLELRGEVRELRDMLLALTRRVHRIEVRLAGLEEVVQRLDSEVRALRDWASREFAEVRNELRQLRREAGGRDAALRRDVDALAARIDRLEKRLEER